MWFNGKLLIIALMLSTFIITAQKQKEVVPQYKYACSQWVMNDISFSKTVDSLKSISVTANIIDRLFVVKNDSILVKDEIKNSDIIYVKNVLLEVLNNASDILLIEEDVKLKITNDDKLNVSVNCNKKRITIDLKLVRKLFLKSLDRAQNITEKHYNKITKSRNNETPFNFCLLWSENYLKQIEAESQESQKIVAQQFNRISYFAFSEFYRFFLFTFSHEMYHLLANCPESYTPDEEKKADLLGAVSIQFLYRHITYKPGELTKCIFDKDDFEEETDEELIEFLYGAEIEHIIDFLYKGTPYEKGNTNYLKLEERKKFVFKNINNVHINKLYKNYEKSIKEFNNK